MSFSHFIEVDSRLRSGDIFLEELHNFDFQNDKSKLVSFVNPFSYGVLARSECIEYVDTLYSDGFLHCLLHRLFHWTWSFKRASFDYSSVAGPVFTYLESQRLSVGLVGGTFDEVSKARCAIEARFPRVNIATCRSGFFDNAAVMGEFIEHLNVDVVIVGMGTPRQELLGMRIKNRFHSGKLVYTCGGFISQTALRDDYYAPLIKKLGLRWLQRCVMHSHVRRRVLIDYPVFVWKYCLFQVTRLVCARRF